MRVFILILVALVVGLMLGACGEDPKAKKQFPMTCARQSAMFEAGYKYYWSGDRLAVYGENGDQYMLSKEESAQGFMTDLCAVSAGGYYEYEYNYDYGYDYRQGDKKRRKYKKNRRNANDRAEIREENNSPRDDK